MPNYDNYRPEINYSDDAPQTPSQEEIAEAGQAEQTPRKRRSQRKNQDTKVDKPASKEKKTIVKSGSSLSKFADWFKSPTAKILAGILMGCLTIYFGVTFCSYFKTCVNDQSEIATATIGTAKNIANPGGEGGARLAEMVINQGFGIGSLVIILWLGAICLKLLIGRPKFKTLDFTIKCFVGLITLSLVIGLLTYTLQTSVNWGGYHGTYVNEFIINFIGPLGAILLSVFMIALFVIICLNDLIKWIIKVRKIRAEKRRIEEEEKATRLAKEEEIRRMQEQEEIDDLRAGESAVINKTDITDTTDEQTLQFDEDESSLYDITDMEAAESNSDLAYRSSDDSIYEVNDETKLQDSDADNNNNNNTSNIDSNDNDNIDDSDNTDKIVDEIEEIESEGSVNTGIESMVVNVNSATQSDQKRFRPDIEHFESHKYKFPPYDILADGAVTVNIDQEELNSNKHRIEKTLLDFGIPITSIEATVGPTVTLYEIVPDSGVKIAKIRSLADNIALSLAANGVRIIAPIPGKGTVGIEVENKNSQIVSMRTVIKSKKFQETKYNLPIALGRTISNDVYMADLAKMPHLLVAGATGQGKSVGLNVIIASLLYCKAPHEIKFVMIDPKQVEFSLYNKLKNYYMASIPSDDDEPVITDMKRVESTLNSLCIEMDQRYTLLKNAHTRNIEEYNTKIRQGNLNPAEGHKFLPYIVVIVDEFGDLIMQLKKNVEMPIARLAQKARAVGMHVILATQRPSTDVITGIIKANFPARIAFKVSQGYDSKTILDAMGAQQLIGRGDMLIFNNSEMVRVQCAFINTPEVEQLCDYIERQPYPQGVYMLPEPMMEGGSESGASVGGPISDKDPLFVEVARAVVNSGKASTSNVQRHYEIGYNRAGRIMDQLERAGIVGPAQGGKPRTVLVDPMGLEDILAQI